MDTTKTTPKKVRKHTQFSRETKSYLRKNSTSTQASMKDLAVFPISRSPNISLVSLNCNEENPIMFAINPRKFDGKNLEKMDSKRFINFLSVQKNINKSKKISSNKSSGKSFQKGILRWDQRTFQNKSQVQNQELEFLQKKIHSEESINFIKQYPLRFLQENNVCEIQLLDKRMDCPGKRKDAFGNIIKKGGKQHRVSFAFHGKMELTRKWGKLRMDASGPSQDEINLLKNTSAKFIESQQKDNHKKQRKKRCCLF